MIAAITAFLAGLFSNFWASLSELWVNTVDWTHDFVIGLVVVLVRGYYDFLAFCVGLLPDAPKFPDIPNPPPIFTQLNYYLPLSEAFALIAFLVSCYVIRASINFARFIRGGG